MSDAWKRLDGSEDGQFRMRRAALMEYARARLPTRFSRAVVAGGVPDRSATPAEIWRRGDDVALIWHVRPRDAPADAPPRSVVGVLHQAAGHSVEILSPDRLGSMPAAWEGFEWIDLAGPFWPPAPTAAIGQGAEAAVAPAPPAPASADVDADGAATEPAPAPAEPRDRIQALRRSIDDAFRQEWARQTRMPLGAFECQAGPWDEASAQWRRVADAQERQRVARLLQQAGVCNFSFDARSTRMALLAREVPYYRRCRLYRVIDMRGPRSRFTSFVLHLESADIACLYRESRPIHEFNQRRSESGELAIDASNATAYLRYFCEFVHGDAGAFSIIEQQSDIRWLSTAARAPGAKDRPAEASDRLKAAIIEAIHPAAMYRTGPTGEADVWPAPPEPADPAAEEGPPSPIPMFCRAMVGYGRHLFMSGLTVSADGGVAMFVDKPLHDAPLPIQPLNFNLEFQFGLRIDPDRRPEPATRGRESAHG